MAQSTVGRSSSAYARRFSFSISLAVRIFLVICIAVPLFLSHQKSIPLSPTIFQRPADVGGSADQAQDPLPVLSTATLKAGDSSNGPVLVSGSRTRPNADVLQAQAQPPAFPLKVSADGRYLVDQNNVPYLIKGDSAWAIPYNISTADADSYLAQRQAQGFNTVYLTDFDNTYGNGRSDYSTFDGIVPFTTAGDLSTPNPAYFARLDTDVQLATAHHMAVVLIPVDAGAGNSGSLPLLRSNGLAKCYNYGVFLGTRYRGYANVMWGSGVDFQTWNSATTYGGATDDQLVEAVERGIAAAAPGQLQTVELNYDHSSTTDDPSQIPLVGLSWVYDQWPQYDYMYREYNRTVGTPPHHLPYYLGEGDYEGENNTGRDPSTPLALRKQEYWSALGGASGQMFGNHYTWGFFAGWQNNIATVGASQFMTMSRLIGGLPWWTFVPDQGHSVMTAGYGTYSATGGQSITQNDYAPTVRSADGTLVLSYLPTVRTVTMDLGQLAGPVTAQWFDPTTGNYSTIGGSPFANSGSRQFTPPGPNASGDPDWVLLLTAASGSSTATPPPSPPPTPPQGGGGTVGYTKIGSITDSGLTNTPTGSRFLSGSGGQIVSMSVHVGAVDQAPANKYQVAVYTDNNGSPGTLVGQSQTGTLAANQWNTIPLSVGLLPNTAYWFIYNTNASSANLNDMQYDNVGTNQGFYSSYAFGSWPPTLPRGIVGGWEYSMYITYADGGTVTLTQTSTPTPVPSPTQTPSPAHQPPGTPTFAPTPTNTPGNGTTVGYATIGSITDSGLANTPSGSRFMSGNGGRLASISVHVGAVDTPPRNLFQVALYTDAGGVPGNLIAQTQNGTLAANSWNSLPITATLLPNTAYWFIYNTNASSTRFNDMQYDTVRTNQGFYSSYAFGSWPQTMPQGRVGGWEYSIFATYASSR